MSFREAFEKIIRVEAVTDPHASRTDWQVLAGTMKPVQIGDNHATISQAENVLDPILDELAQEAELILARMKG